MNIPMRKTNAQAELRLTPKDIPFNNSNDHIGQCYSPAWPKSSGRGIANGRNVLSNSTDLSPAPLKLSMNKTPNTIGVIGPEPQYPPIKVYSEHIFPLPPKNVPCSQSQASSPRSPFPPPYSTLTPSTSASSLKETLSKKSHNNNFIKRSVHAVRRTQSSPDAKQISQCKPLPDRPEHGGNKIWKQTMFRLTPAPNGATHQNLNTAYRIDPKVSIPCHQTLPPRAMTPSTDPSSIITRDGEKKQEDHAKRNKSPDIKRQDIADTDGSKSSTPKGSPGLKEETCVNRQRLTSEETLWLHRNYRGEATFVKAWGLHITRNVDRERGLEIMRELMAAESPRGNEQRMREHFDKQQEEIGSFRIPTPRDMKGLQAIEEERNDRNAY